MNNPLISIVVCTYNRAEMLKQTIEAIFAQKYRPVEILIVDDGSTDGTKELIASCGDRVRYYRQENRGIAAARTTGCKLAKGEYIAFQDDDDLMLPDRIPNLYEAFCRYPIATLAVGDWAVIDRDGSLTGKRSKFSIPSNNEEPILLEDGYKAVLWPLITPVPHTTLFRRTDGERIDWFDDARFFHSCSDTDFFARLGRLGPIVYVPKIVSYYRVGHAQIWSKKLLTEYSRFLLFEKHLEFIKSDKNELKIRLQLRMVNILKQIASLKKNGQDLSDGIPQDYLKRGLLLLNGKQRLNYQYYSLIKLSVKNLLFR